MLAGGPLAAEVAVEEREAELVAPDGRPVRLRGVGLGGWMKMEHSSPATPAPRSSCCPGCGRVLGDDLSDRYFDRFLEAFFAPDDARHLASLGLNLVRLPVNYRHFEDDVRPSEIDERN